MGMRRGLRAAAAASILFLAAGVGGAAASFCVLPDIRAGNTPTIEDDTSVNGHTVTLSWTVDIDDAYGTLEEFCLQWREYDENHSGLSDNDGGAGPWRSDLEHCTGSSEMEGSVSVDECETPHCQFRVKGVYNSDDGSVECVDGDSWHTRWSRQATVEITANNPPLEGHLEQVAGPNSSA